MSQPCGTNAAYVRHYRHGEEPCPACREARARHRAAAGPVVRVSRPQPVAARRRPVRPPWVAYLVRQIEAGLIEASPTARPELVAAARHAARELADMLVTSASATRDLADALARHRRDTATLVDEITDQRDRADDECVRLRRLLDQRAAA